MEANGNQKGRSMIFDHGTRVISANGNPGTVVTWMHPSGSVIGIKLDNGRQISCLASLCKPIDMFAALEEDEARELRTKMYRALSDAGDFAEAVNRNAKITDAEWQRLCGVMMDCHQIHQDLCRR